MISNMILALATLCSSVSTSHVGARACTMEAIDCVSREAGPAVFAKDQVLSAAILKCSKDQLKITR